MDVKKRYQESKWQASCDWNLIREDKEQGVETKIVELCNLVATSDEIDTSENVIVIVSSRGLVTGCIGDAPTRGDMAPIGQIKQQSVYYHKYVPKGEILFVGSRSSAVLRFSNYTEA